MMISCFVYRDLTLKGLYNAFVETGKLAGVALLVVSPEFLK